MFGGIFLESKNPRTMSREAERQNTATENIERPINANSRINPSIIRKISMISSMKNESKLEQPCSDREETAQSDTPNSDQSSVFSSENQSNASLRSRSSTATRYTISARSEASPSPACAKRSANAKILTHDAKGVQVTSVTNFRNHNGQTATICPPLIGKDLSSRLESLREFRAWNDQIHDTTEDHPQAGHTTVSVSKTQPTITQNTPPVMRELSLPVHRKTIALKHESKEPTSFSNPRPPPLLATSRADVGHVSKPSASISPPPVLDLCDTDSKVASVSRKSGSNSKSTLIITGASKQELKERASSLSRSASQASSQALSQPVTHSHTLTKTTSRQGRPPPTSFPQKFYERHPESNLTFSYGKFEGSSSEISTLKSEQTTPSISPCTTPTLLKTKSTSTRKTDPAITSHDARGRPTFYETIHYFTACPHTCPPANRPIDLNAQPRPDPDLYSTNPIVTRSVIPGSCFNCDTKARRLSENKVLDSHAMQVAERTTQLADLVEQLELLSPTDTLHHDHCEHDKYPLHLLGQSSFPEDAHDLDHEYGPPIRLSDLLPPTDDPVHPPTTPAQKAHQSRIVTQIRALEAAIDEIKDHQNEAVKRVWRGYTPRWGPATLGIQRGRYSTDIGQYATREDVVSLMEQRMRKIDEALDRDDDIGELFEEEDGDVDNDRQRNIERDNGTNESFRDLPGARKPGQGKMKVGWIRDEK